MFFSVVQVDSLDGTAISGLDYSGVHTQVTFQPSTSPSTPDVMSITVEIRNDKVVEGDENFYLRLSVPAENAQVDGPTDLEIVIQNRK